jgi:signal transduction histidine kinase
MDRSAQSIAHERQRDRLGVAEDERRRWARELHDDTLQSLSALRIAMSGARRSGETEALRTAVSSAVEQLDEMIANLRGLINDLRPAALDELGITAALEGLAEGSHVHEIDVSLTVALEGGRGTRAERLTPELETSIYRIVQEALTNAAKHGRAVNAQVEVREDDRGIHLIVRDDGAGFDRAASTDGFGLLGIRERVQLLGGELVVDSSPGDGTTVRAVLPAHAPPAARAVVLPG